MADQVIIEFIGDNSQLTPSIDVLKKIGAVTAEDEAQFKKFGAESKKAMTITATEGKAAIKGLSDVKKGVVSLANAFEEGLTEAVKGSFDESSMSAEKFGKKLKDSFGEGEKKSNSLKAQLRQLKEELSKMDDAGKGGTKTFENLAVKAAKLEDQMGDTAARVRALASDTANIDAAVQGIQAVASGFQIAAGAQQLFGDGNEDVQRALVKLNAIMAITTGIQQLQNAFQKETILVQKLGILQTKAAAIAQGIYATAVGASTGAMRAFRIALFATGIGAIIAAIIYLAANFDKLTSSVSTSNKTQKAYNDTIEDYKKGATSAIEKVNEVKTAFELARKGTISQDQALKTYNETLGDSLGRTNSLAVAERNLLEKAEAYIKITALKAQANALFAKSADATAKALTAQNEDQTDWIDKGIAGIKNYFGNIGSAQNGLIEAQEKGVAKTKATSEANAKILDEGGKNLLTQAEDLGKKYKVVDEKIGKEQYEQAKKNAEKAKELAKKNAEALFEIKQRALEKEQALYKIGADSENSSLQFRLHSLKEYNDATVKLIELRREKELSQEQLTKQQIQNINDKFNAQLLEATDAFGKAKVLIIKQNNDKEEQEHRDRLQSFKDEEETKLKNSIDSLNKLYESFNNTGSTQKNTRLADLEKQYNDGLISLKIYEQKREEISKEFEKKEILNEISRLNLVIYVRKNAGQDVTDLQNSLYAAEDNLRKIDLEAHKKTEEEKTAKTKKELAERKKVFSYTIDLLKQSIANVLDDGVAKVALTQLADLYKSIREISDDENLSQSEKFAEYAAATIAATQAIVNSSFTAGAERRKEALEAEIAQLDVLKAKELDNKNLTEQQKNDIDEKFRQKEAAAKRRAYEADKKAKIAQAEINGALAITNILATRPKFDLGIGDAIMIAAALATTAIQISNIKKAQVPQFKAGKVKIDGPGTTTSDSILARISKGESVINAASTKKWESALHAINTDDFESYIRSMIPKADTDVMSNAYVGKDGAIIDYEKMASAIAGKIPEPTYINMNIDENGINSFITKKNSVTHFKNKRYSL